MASGTVKVRLVAGSREIELEGSSADVDALLEKWWREPSDDTSQQGAVENQSKPDPKTRRSKPKPKKTGGTAGTRRSKQDDPNAFDAHGFANRVKEDEQFPVFQKKIINVPADWYNKTAFVIWYAERPLTSGEIISALNALDVRGHIARVSNAIAQNMQSFISDKQRQVGVTAAYRLTATAKTNFEKWLLKEPDGDG